MNATLNLMIECPDWDDVIPQGREPVFLCDLESALRSVSQCGHEIVNCNEICEWHYLLFRNVVPLDYYAGHFRQDSPDKVCLACDVEVAGVPGAPFQIVANEIRKLSEALRISMGRTELRWSTMAQREKALRLAVLSAAFIGGFIRIHPFRNGNGRTSRLIWRWVLLRFGVPPQVRVHPRPGQDTPYAQLMAEAMHGNTGPLAFAILRHLATNPPSMS